ncbi:prolyl 3-hydroxylase 2-like [Bolinopsis microptera]|uniref:prolyl 3-hydroxylase 2-like n=1 Tax=Bolinopsis microptera TaxID=2820187 RepID=UPI003078F474
MLLLLIAVLLEPSESQLVVDHSIPSKEDYLQLYQTSLVHYRNSDYQRTQYFTELALADKRYRDVMLVKCFQRCSEEGSQSSQQLFFLSLVTGEKCTRKCMKNLFGQPLQLPLWAIKDFKTRKPFSFLQFSYYQIGDLTSAYEAALVNLKYNQDSEMMQGNVNFYGRKIRDLSGMLRHEQPDSLDKFNMGVKSYTNMDYAGASQHLDSALILYVEEVTKCKILCATGYDEFEGKVLPDLNDTSTFQDQFVKLYHKVMECRYRCLGKFDKMTDLREDYLPQLLNYLQFSAFQTKDLEFAYQIAAAYLTLNPGDQTMTNNLKYYTEQLGTVPDQLTMLSSLIEENSLDMEVLSAIVGKKEMRKRLKDKQDYMLGDMGLISELNADKNILWRNSY